MNAERLLTHYERVADAPYAIPRLRRFVLDLAVRGKVVPQDPSDEPASKLLKRIAKEKAGLVKAGEIRRQKSGPDIDRAAFPITPPAGWALTRLATISRRIHYGYTASADAALKDVRLLRITDIQNNIVDWRSVPGCMIEADEVDQYKLDKGDILIARTGGTIGKTFLVRNVPVTAVFASYLIRVQGTRHVFNEYLKLFLESLLYWTQLREGARGTGQPNVNGKTLGNLVLPLPPLAEQYRIVAKVDELMALCDGLEAARTEREAVRDRLTAASLARLKAPDSETFRDDARFSLDALPALTARPDQIKQLRQTILNLAVCGKLVPQDPNDEPASELLKRIAAGKAESKKKTGDARIKMQPDPKPEDLPMALPQGWAVQSFENLFLFIDYRGNTPPKTNDGIPLITAKNIRMGHLNREPREYISQKTFKAWMTRGFPEIGDLFFTTEAPLANICLNDIDEPFALAQRAICFQPYGKIDTKFLMFALMSDLMQSLIDAHATGMTAKGIKAANLKPLPIPVPPLAEQHRIVAKVNELMALCNRLEASLTTDDATRHRLLDALLAEALAPDEEELEAAE